MRNNKINIQKKLQNFYFKSIVPRLNVRFNPRLGKVRSPLWMARIFFFVDKWFCLIHLLLGEILRQSGGNIVYTARKEGGWFHMETSKTCGGVLADFDVTRLIRFLLLKKHFPPRDFFFNDAFRLRAYSNFETARITIFSINKNKVCSR